MLTLYKPNNSNKGHGLGLKFNSKDANLFLSLVKQNGFNENKKGIFNGGKQVIVALGQHEVGGILSVINDLRLPMYKTDKISLVPIRREQSYHHESEKQSSKLKFSPYVDVDTGAIKGLSISINQTIKESGESTSFSFWAAPDEICLIEQYLKFTLEHFFTAAYSAEKEAFKQRQKDKESGAESEKKVSPVQKKQETLVSADGDSDSW